MYPRRRESQVASTFFSFINTSPRVMVYSAQTFLAWSVLAEMDLAYWVRFFESENVSEVVLASISRFLIQLSL